MATNQAMPPPASRLIYSNGHVFNGFAAQLTKQAVDTMSTQGWFVQAFPDSIYVKHTTYSPDFLGLRHPQHGVWNTSNMGEGIIIGVLDSGVTPGHPSFDDDGMLPAPAKWKGRCDFNGSLCNNKIIGAKSFFDGIKSMVPRYTGGVPVIDEDGHGTHTASTAAGAFVDDASLNGMFRGLAAGMAPCAHLAIYKVCLEVGCSSSDVLAAMDSAVADGVDVLSVSLGAKGSSPFAKDLISMGAFGAISKGVFVSLSAGNSGPGLATLNNEAPWALLVAASTTDRRAVATVRLGDFQEFNGASLHQPRDFEPMLPLVYGGAAGKPNSSFCANGTLDGFDVRGKIVVCEHGGVYKTEKDDVVRKAGGAGMIAVNSELLAYGLDPQWHVLPALHVAHTVGLKIKAYIKSTKNPTAAIAFKGAVTQAPHLPAIAYFSSRGPGQSPGILKPDITGPGVGILAAWQVQVGPSAGPSFYVASGTSMACPHLSGVAALIKKEHPDWSPAAIKSAIMTTAYVGDRDGQPIVDERRLPADYYAMGAGHANPPKAMDPGLVYDIKVSDYIAYFCGLGFSSDYVGFYARQEVDCSTNITEGELNYPSITVSLGPKRRSIRLIRTVTNVGDAKSTYLPEVDIPKGVSVLVKPTKLWFTKVNQKKRFRIIFRMDESNGVGIAQGRLRWVSDKHVVQSPILITFK